MARFTTGNTGGSTGPHLDFRVYNAQTGGYEDPSKFTSYLSSGGEAFNFDQTSGFGMRTHPIHGDQRMHYGIDYATPVGTQIDIKGGKLLSTWDDKGGGGGIMSQYLVQTEDGPREFLMLHGSKDNPLTGTSAVTDYDSSVEPSNDTPTTPQQEAVERTQNYAKMSKAELDAAYDGMRNDPAKAGEEGMKMHKAFFGKS